MSTHYKKAQFTEVGLMGCNIVIEGNKVVHTGTISLVAGDSIEIELPQYNQFLLGEQIKAIIYSPEGMINLRTSVIAKDLGTIILIIPTSLHNLLNKRKDPRVKIELQGRLYAITNKPLEETNNLIQPEPITIINISLGGIGFILNSLEIRKGSVLFLEIAFDSPLLTTFEVMHVKAVEQGKHYGCSFIDLPQETLNALRAFILKKQIYNRSDERKESLNSPMISIEGK